MAQTDTLGRSTFHHIAPQARVKPTERELRWFAHIERHGPQSSRYLHELTRHTHRCKDTSLRQLQKLRAGGLLTLPRQQRAFEHADFNPYIYDTTLAAKDCLFEAGLDVPNIRPTGHWWHSYLTSCVTSSIEIAAAKQGIKYIPTHALLAKKGISLAMPLSNGQIIPDQLFALDYGGSFRAFALEVDRGTEPLRSSAARKSLAHSIAQYGEVISQNLASTHYGLNAPLLVLWVFISRKRHAQFLEMLSSSPVHVRQSVLCQTVAERSIYRETDSSLFDKQWLRAGQTEVSIGA